MIMINKFSRHNDKNDSSSGDADHDDDDVDIDKPALLIISL